MSKMLLRSLWILTLACVLSQGAAARAADGGGALNSPIPEAARQDFSRGVKLERADRYEEAAVEFKKAFESSPNYVRARAE